MTVKKGGSVCKITKKLFCYSGNCPEIIAASLNILAKSFTCSVNSISRCLNSGPSLLSCFSISFARLDDRAASRINASAKSIPNSDGVAPFRSFLQNSFAVLVNRYCPSSLSNISGFIPILYHKQRCANDYDAPFHRERTIQIKEPFSQE